MPIRTAIQNFFNSYTAIQPHSFPASAGNNYEFYIYTQLLESLDPTYKLVPLGLIGGQFKFNCGPSKLKNSNSYYQIEQKVNPAIKYQVRSGIQFKGESGMTHEVDISVIPENPVASSDPDFPHRSNLKLAIECKKYTAERLLKGELRKALGAAVDLAYRTGGVTIGDSIVNFIVFNRPFFVLLATNVDFAVHADFRAYLSKYNVSEQSKLEPGQTTAINNFHQTIQRISSTW